LRRKRSQASKKGRKGDLDGGVGRAEGLMIAATKRGELFAEGGFEMLEKVDILAGDEGNKHSDPTKDSDIKNDL